MAVGQPEFHIVGRFKASIAPTLTMAIPQEYTTIINEIVLYAPHQLSPITAPIMVKKYTKKSLLCMMAVEVLWSKFSFVFKYKTKIAS